MTDLITVVYPDDRGVRIWGDLASNTEVPGQWPYGLEAMRTAASQVTYKDVPSVPSTGKIAAIFGMYPNARRVPSGTTSLTWDEGAAQRMLYHAPAEKMYSGVIWSTDEIMRKENKLRNKAMRSGLRRMDGLWCLSKAQVHPLADWLDVSPQKIEYLPFGIDHEYFKPDLYPPEPMILSVGNDADRDTRTLFQAMYKIHSKFPDIRIVVQTNSNLTAPEGVQKIARVPHADLKKLYTRAAVVVVATRMNLHGSGMTVALEAAASGRPVVITATPGIDDYVDDGVTGYLVPPEDADTLANKAISILRDPAAGAQMGLQGRRRIEEYFNTRRMAKDLVAMVGV
ncbi:MULTISPECIES: glycosyltransferase family 4 protein [Rhodococcus]|uniref:glycosyltransferase family 4 protein n=1 Tax=Rhodococcus TaxID=1827 RepID=UPI0009B88E6A|nr:MULTISPECIES: glycosyltransferase family 4 protein [Rhodococcus]